jgi:holliday junction DNA helicase RuvA
MIGKLKGLVDAIGESHCVIDVNGVGYDVSASSRTLGKLKLGEPVVLSIETYVREDAIKLFGFTSEVERSWFRTLQNVQGVGAKVALSILGTVTISELSTAIALGQPGVVERATGVGKKLAQRIVLELKDKAPALGVAGVDGPTGVGGKPLAPPEGNAAAEAMSALTNLGYQSAQAAQAIAVAHKELGPDADVAKLIRRGLRELARP